MAEIFEDLVMDMTYASESIREQTITMKPKSSGMTIDRLVETSTLLRSTACMLNRVNWLLEHSDTEDSFNEKWDKELTGPY